MVSFPDIDALQAIPDFDGRRRLESSGQYLVDSTYSNAQLSEVAQSKQFKPVTMLPSGLTGTNETHLSDRECHFDQRIETMNTTRRSSDKHFIPHSAPPNVQCHPNVTPHLLLRNSVFSFCPDMVTGELGWNVEQRNDRFQASPLLNSKMRFPIRPLIPGVLAKIHNDWLEEYPQPSVHSTAGLGDEASRNLQPNKRFPTPHMTFESQHIRILWQELERRRILELEDIQLLAKLRQEAKHLLRMEAFHYASSNVMSPYSHENIFNSIPEPSEEQLKIKVQSLWEQTKKSAAYAVGLLRQAEYCIAHGHLGFMPLNHTQRRPTESERNETNGQATAAMANSLNIPGPNQRSLPHTDVNTGISRVGKQSN